MSSIGRENLSLGEKMRMVSWPLLLLVTLVACVGFASLYSAAGGSWSPWAGKQLARFIIGMAGLLVVALIDVRVWLRAAYPLYAVGMLLLFYVDIKGHIGMGAQRWINLGFMQLQPSEIVKITTILALARFFHGATGQDVKNPLFLLAPLALVGAPVLFVMVQPDLGTAMTILIVSGGMFLLAGVSYWMFGAAIAAGLAFLPIGWHMLRDYQKNRVLVFMNPESDPLGAGYHITQSKIALGSGGFFGKGFLQGSQSRLDFLPEKQTDFIFTLFTEEWGFVGGAGLLLLFCAIIVYGYVIALNCRNQFGRLLALGVITNFFTYVFINMGMVMGLLPVVGVPLPMVSYGGTAMLSVLFGFGLLMSAHVHRDVKFTRRGLDMA